MRERRTVLNIGVGGATSSGKTTMAKHLVDLLTPGVRAMQECMMPAVAPAFDTRGPAVALVHQDDFLNQELPWNDDFGAEDWDTPYGSVDYRKTADALAYVAQYGDLPLWYKTHDHLNELRPLPVTPAFRFKWQARFQELLTHAAKQSLSQGDVGQPLCIVVTEGFLLYFDPEVRGYMDIKLFIRTPRAEVLFRRENRGGYITETGSHWVVRTLSFVEHLTDTAGDRIHQATLTRLYGPHTSWHISASLIMAMLSTGKSSGAPSARARLRRAAPFRT